MFEDSLVISRGSGIPAGQRWTAAASSALQVAVAAAFIALPILHPDSLPFHASAANLVPPIATKPKPIEIQHSSSSSPQSAAAPPLSGSNRPMIPSLLPSVDQDATEEPTFAQTASMGAPDFMASMRGSNSATGPAVSLAHPNAPAKPVRISAGVVQGMLLAPIKPIYPPIAKAAHVEGDVVVQATISRTGSVEELHVVSGPAMLQNAAMDAIRAARYQPFQLNGEPTAVEVCITVRFRMGA